ncbi:MAG: hypothetical protein Q8P06_01215, partial [Candidatus Azambacteria bacterium]|nr:hypothetical protein [Candidatus Azambacteria bacterium]
MKTKKELPDQKLETVKLSRADKILLVLYEMSAGVRNPLRYEDIVASVFREYPQDFQLRGYPQYPDSSDLVHKPLYDFRKNGLLEASNKVFTLTERGISWAKRLKDNVSGLKIVSNEKLSRYAEEEISRITDLEGYKLFLTNECEKITDADFYNYLGVSVKTKKNDFLGRLKTVTDAIKELKQIKSVDPLRTRISEYQD